MWDRGLIQTLHFEPQPYIDLKVPDPYNEYHIICDRILGHCYTQSTVGGSYILHQLVR